MPHPNTPSYCPATDSQFNANRGYASHEPYRTRQDTGKFPVFAKAYSDLFASKARMQILEVGCGPGQFWEAAAQAQYPEFPHLWLTDISKGMLARCKRTMRSMTAGYLVPSHHHEVVDLNKMLPFGDNWFDIVMAHNVIYHAVIPRNTVSELHRILEPGGTLGISSLDAGIESELYETAHALDPRIPASSFTEHCHVGATRQILTAFFPAENIQETRYEGGRTYETVDALLESFAHQPDIQQLELAPDFWAQFRSAMSKRMEKQGGTYRVDLGMTLFHCKKAGVDDNVITNRSSHSTAP